MAIKHIEICDVCGQPIGDKGYTRLGGFLLPGADYAPNGMPKSARVCIHLCAKHHHQFVREGVERWWAEKEAE